MHSQHLLGQAADIQVSGMSARELYAAAKMIPQFRGFGVDDEGIPPRRCAPNHSPLGLSRRLRNCVARILEKSRACR